LRPRAANVNGGWVGVGPEGRGSTSVVSMSHTDIETTFVDECHLDGP
jgi:hypothetical protein